MSRGISWNGCRFNSNVLPKTKFVPTSSKSSNSKNVFVGPTVEGGNSQYIKVAIGPAIEIDTDYKKVISGSVKNQIPTFVNS